MFLTKNKQKKLMIIRQKSLIVKKNNAKKLSNFIV